MASDRNCGSPTTWLGTALGSSSQRHFGMKSCTAYTLPTRAKTHLTPRLTSCLLARNHLGHSENVHSCPASAERLPSHTPKPLLSNPLLSRPSENTAADLFHYSGRTFLVYTDRYSGWPAVGTTGRTATSSDVIYLLKEWMTDKGIPTILKTDGGPQFASQAFSDFCRQWGIHHVLSSPHLHEANGAAEAAMKTMKALIAKTTTTGRIDVDEFRSGLLEFRNTPQAHGFIPTQLLYGRTRWDTIAEVFERKPSGRSYAVNTESGRVYWCNRRFLRLYLVS